MELDVSLLERCPISEGVMYRLMELDLCGQLHSSTKSNISLHLAVN